MTVLDSVIQGLDASTRFASSEVAPTAVLWTDAKSEWLPLLDQLKTRLPQLLVLGEYGFDPATDGEFVAGEKLGLPVTSNWEGLWSRFREAPASYNGVISVLRKAKPKSLVAQLYPEYWPDENETAEETLRKELLSLAGVDHGSARTKIPRWLWQLMMRNWLGHVKRFQQSLLAITSAIASSFEL